MSTDLLNPGDKTKLDAVSEKLKRLRQARAGETPVLAAEQASSDAALDQADDFQEAGIVDFNQRKEWKQPETMRETMNLAEYANHILYNPSSDNKPQLKITFTEEESRKLAELGDEFQAKVLRNALIRRKLEEAGIIDFNQKKWERESRKEYEADPDGYMQKCLDSWHDFAVREGIIQPSKPLTFTEEEAKELDELHDAICNLSDEEFRAWGRKKGYE